MRKICVSVFVPIVAVAVILIMRARDGAAIEFGAAAEPVVARAMASLSSVPPGGTIGVAVKLELAPHWHINANKVNDEFLIPTSVIFEAPAGFEIRGPLYPAPVEKKLDFSEQPLLLYEKEAVVGALLVAPAKAEPGDVTAVATVTYQACDNEKCLAPETKRIEIPIRVSAISEAIDAVNTEVFSSIDFASLADNSSLDAGGRLGAIVANRGYVVAFLLVFLWGLALNLTPCVYPIIPITVGYFGGQSGGRSSATLALASVYVLGMAITYSALGLFAALTGSLFGTALQNVFVVGFVSLVLVALALSMFGLYDIRMPARLSNLAGATSGRGGYVGAFLMGLTVGIVAAPCIGPFVLALLTFVGESADPLLGFSLFFTLAIGLGLPFLFLAMISGSIAKLPKSGEWMEWVKKLFGVILIAMAIFFLQPHIERLALGGIAYWLSMGLLFIVGGLALGFSKRTQSSALFFLVLRRFVGIAGPLFGLYLILTPGHIIARGAPGGGISWSAYDPTALAQAKADGRYVLIDFTADWCLPCKELDHKTFSKQTIVEATADFVRLRADLTDVASQDVLGLREQFSIRGVPTVVFIDRRGNERNDLRVFGFVDDQEFLDRLTRLKTGA
jgi:thiol:disulfide interchange protein DsbD